LARGARKGTGPQEPRAELTTALEAVLSTEEVRRATAAAFLALDEAGRQRLLEQLPVETAEALRPVLNGVGGSKRSRPPIAAGRAKVRQDWQQLWNEWNESINESGYEEGRYVHQEHDWEPPYLDRSALIDDLEGIAKRMRSLMSRVWTEGLDPKRSFIGEVREAANEIGAGLPEWFDGERSDFGPEVTRCLLDWEMRVAQREGLGPFEFVVRIRTLENSLRGAGIDGESVLAFVKAMPQEEQRAVYEGMRAVRQTALWSEALANPNSDWFRLRQRLARKWDRAGFAESCRSHIEQDWTLALPLISGHVRKNEYSKALELVDEAMRSLLRLEPEERWVPTQELLVSRRPFGFSRGSDAQAFRLLGLWQKAAAATGDTATAAALKVQCAIGREWDDWDRSLEAFRGSEPTCEDLFDAWRTTVARASVDRSPGSENGDKELQPAEWVRLLATAASGAMDGRALVEGIRSWLARLEKRPDAIGAFKESIATLLLDVGQARGALKERSPRLKRLLEGERGDHTLERSRRRWLVKLKGHELLPDLLGFLTRHVHAFMPDPRCADYEQCADWMAAVHEFAPEKYRKILQSWQDVHRRRRNLWKAMSARKLPI